ncbi:HNH endonuclease [Sphingomonas sp. G124]|uniref:HNH endonuclease n=1 Tax=Sphingomonas cremea TaxID=2904799 RepID=A0A9X1QPL6_9SPHN|nr:HNH endonuclease signature motif containing protein [Sphingomonas cremea]MCF2515867.1 HNH endonuclease [Sphingomonas cremea]
MDFTSGARKTQKPTIEHLQPKSLDGTDALENLVLCHPGCNKQLGDRPRDEKERLRARRLRRMQKSNPPVAIATPAKAASAIIATRSGPPNWRSIALIALTLAAFFAGLSIGQMLS